MNAPVAPQTIGANKLPFVTADQLANDFAHVEEAVAGFEKQLTDTPLVIEDDEDLALINAAVPTLRTGIGRVKELRDEHKRPHLDANALYQSFFGGYETRIEAVKTELERRGGAYLKKKAAAEAARLAAVEAAARVEQATHETTAIIAAKENKPEEMKAAATQAREAETRAVTAGAAATAKPADLARTKTETGTATLKTAWIGKVVNFATIDIVKLRPYLAPAHIEQALRAFVKAGGRECDGATITQESNPDFR